MILQGPIANGIPSLNKVVVDFDLNFIKNYLHIYYRNLLVYKC